MSDLAHASIPIHVYGALPHLKEPVGWIATRLRFEAPYPDDPRINFVPILLTDSREQAISAAEVDRRKHAATTSTESQTLLRITACELRGFNKVQLAEGLSATAFVVLTVRREGKHFSLSWEQAFSSRHAAALATAAVDARADNYLISPVSLNWRWFS